MDRARASLLLIAGSLCLPRSALAQDPEAPKSEEPEAPSAQEPEAPKVQPEAPKVQPEARKAQELDIPKAQEPKAAKDSGLLSRMTVNFYGAILPFVEHVATEGATPPGFTDGASQVIPEEYTGWNERPRFRMTAGTSNIGFRGTLDVFDQLKLTWQVESAVPIDGNGPPNTIASRNSHIGFMGDWGTLIFGNWDTPWKWATLVTINPIRGGYVPDYTSILSTPGFGVSALNTTSVFLGSISNAAFYRREPNSIQYWSPTLGGFSARLNYTLNEPRPSRADVSSPTTRIPNPYLISGYVGYDGFGLRVRYAYEMHKDYFGLAQLGGSVPMPSDEVSSSTDQGHQGTIQYALTWSPRLRTRVVGTGEILSYKVEDTTPDAINEYSRPAFYALLEQSFFGSRVWGAYGQAFPGECRRVGGGACTTKGLQARLVTLGYMYEFNDDLNVHLVGYRIYNDVSSRHSTYIPLEEAPGADLTGIGFGFFYAFDVSLLP